MGLASRWWTTGPASNACFGFRHLRCRDPALWAALPRFVSTPGKSQNESDRDAAGAGLAIVSLPQPPQPPAGGHSCNGDDTTLPSRGLYQGRIMHPQRSMRVEHGHEYSPRYMHGSLAVPGSII